MSIRPAKFADIPRLTELVKEGYERCKYKDLGAVDEKAAKGLFMHAIQRHGLQTEGGACVFVAERNGKVEGYIIGVLARVYHVGDHLEASDLHFFQSENGNPADAVRLFGAYIKWASGNKKVVIARNGATDIIDPDWSRAAKLFERAGFVQSGVIYERRLP